MSESPDLRRYASLSVAAALATIGLKTTAWALTDSVGLLSDAAESLVALYQHHFQAEIRGPKSRRIAPRSCANDGQVEVGG